MKTVKKVVATTVCGAMLVAGSIAGTMAYLTSTDAVNNTFTIGKVAITLDESKVTNAGILVENAAPVKSNEYKLMPGHTYVKDPTVHFKAGSEDSYLFVKVENDIANIESKDNTYENIVTQIEKNWEPLENVDNVYWKKVEATTTDKDYGVFNKFKVDADADIKDYASNKSIKITAYAIQADGFATATAAWDAGNFGGSTSTGE